MVSLGLGPVLRLVLCKYRLPISGILLVKLLDHAVSLGLGPELLSIAGKHSLAINEVLTDLGNLSLLVDGSNDLGGMRFASELCFVGCEYCFPISGILLVKLLDHMVSLGLGPELRLVLCKYRLPISGILLVKLLDHMMSLGLGPELLSIAGKHSLTIDE